MTTQTAVQVPLDTATGTAAAATVDASKVYGAGADRGPALDGVTVDVPRSAASPPSWARRAPASRR